MKTLSTSFNIEVLSDFIVSEVSKLSDKQAMTDGKTPDDFNILYRQLRSFKNKYHFKQDDPIDIVILTDKTHTDDLIEIYNRINYKLSEHKEIATFFKGASKNTSFHFPGGLSVWILTPEEYFYKMKHKMNVISMVILGEKNIPSSLFDKEDKKIDGNFTYFFMEPNIYWDLDKHIAENWQIGK